MPSARELVRVLAPGAPFSIAAFDDMALNTLMATIAQVLAAHVPVDALPDFDYLTQLAAPGLREVVLRESGFVDLHSELFRWSVPLPSFDVVWQVANAPTPFAGAFAVLTPADVEAVRRELQEAVQPYRSAGGGASFEYPMACRLFWGRTGCQPASL